MKTRTVIGGCAMFALAGLIGSPAGAASHSWQVKEVFSNADGTVQFIELVECCGMAAENGVGGKRIVSDATGNVYVIPGNVAGSTAGKSLLFATAGYAALGGPQVDFPLNPLPNGFFSVAGDTVRYGPNPPALNYDVWLFGAVPTDGCNSMNRTGPAVATNTPKNFANVQSTVFAEPADINGDHAVNVLDLVALLLCFGQSAVPSCQAEDVNGDGSVDVLDLVALLLKFGTTCP